MISKVQKVMRNVRHQSGCNANQYRHNPQKPALFAALFPPQRGALARVEVGVVVSDCDGLAVAVAVSVTVAVGEADGVGDAVLVGDEVWVGVRVRVYVSGRASFVNQSNDTEDRTMSGLSNANAKQIDSTW